MERKSEKETKDVKMGAEQVNPLRKERVFVRFIPHEYGYVGSDKRHVAYGGRIEGATTKLCVPVLRSTGTYKNILSNSEKDYLEGALGLAQNALSVYRTENNYWDDYRVILPKEGIHLDLSNPEDYIKYKVLLANSDVIAPSVQDRIERPKATYQFELVKESDETNLENAKMDATMASYKEFGKIEDDLDTMRVLVELLDGRPYSVKEKREFFRARINTIIQSDPKTFLRNVTDPMLHTKVIIRRAQELGKISKRGDYYYIASDGTPLCEAGENPTLAVAAKYLNDHSHQDVKYLLESEVLKNKQ